MKVTLPLFIFSAALVVANGNSSNICTEKISTLLKEFHVNQPIIQNSLLSKINLKTVIKGLSLHGHSIGLKNPNFVHNYHSFLIFTQIQKFNWTFRSTNAPVLVISSIQNERDFDRLEVPIRDEILFYDWNSQIVHETYKINKVHVKRCLGRVVNDENNRLISKFAPAEDYVASMIKRRSNFYGLHMNFLVIKDIYPLYGVILEHLQRKLNFTSTEFVTHDQKVDTAFKTLISGDAIRSYEFILESLTMTPQRLSFLDFLTPINKQYVAIFIPKEEIDELIDWNVYLNPLTNQLWGVILMKCFIFTMIIYVIEWLHGYKLVGSYLILKSFYKLNKRIK